MDASDSTRTKVCTKCGSEKPVSEFHKDKQRSDGLRSSCKHCKIADNAAYRLANPEIQRAYAKSWVAANPEKKRASKKRYYERHAAEVIAKNRAWKLENADRVKAYEADRYWSNPTAQRDRVANYRAANPGYSRNYAYAYRTSYPERVKAASAAWRASHPEKARLALAAWREKNPDANRIHVQNRRAQVRKSGGRLSRDLAERLLKLQRGLCPCCKQPLGDDYHMDHIVPLALGGTNTDDNIQLLRSICNQQKHAKHPVDYMQSKGYLL